MTSDQMRPLSDDAAAEVFSQRLQLERSNGTVAALRASVAQLRELLEATCTAADELLDALAVVQLTPFDLDAAQRVNVMMRSVRDRITESVPHFVK